MSNPLTFLLPLCYDTVHSVLLVQSGPIDLALQVAGRLRGILPGCEIEGLIGEGDRDAAAGRELDSVTTVRWEDRLDVVRRLRRQRYDAVVMLLSRRGSDYLRMLPILLRTRVILAFNDHLDYFPLHVSRLATLSHHLSGRGGVGGTLRWAVGRVIVLPFATLFLVAAVGRLYARTAWRRSRRLGQSGSPSWARHPRLQR